MNTVQILCWNREGYKLKKTKEIRQRNRETFSEEVKKKSPELDIAFLQEEVHMIGTQGGQGPETDCSLFYAKDDYTELYMKEKSKSEALPIEQAMSKFETPAKANKRKSEAATPSDKGTHPSKLYNAIAFKNQLHYTEDTKISITNFLYNVMITSGTLTLSAGKCITREEMKSVMKYLFKHFTGYEDNIVDEVLTGYCSKYPNNEKPFEEYLQEIKHNALEAKFDCKVTINQILLVYDRICIVPLKISGQLILAVSVHGRHVGVDKILHVENILTVLNAIGQSTGCTAIVIGGDFNLDIIRDPDASKLLHKHKFEVPSYKPTVRRVMHARKCIDYFAYKNYCDDYTVQVTEVKQKMLKDCPGLVTVTDNGQYNINLDNPDFAMVEAISDHDPLFAKLILYQSSANSLATAQGAQDTTSTQDTNSLPDTQDTNSLPDTQDTNSLPDTQDTPDIDSPPDTQDTTDSLDASYSELIKQTHTMKIEDVNNDTQSNKQQTDDEDKVKQRLEYDYIL